MPRRPGERDLELARQVGKFRIQHCVLAQQLAIDSRVGQLVPGSAGIVVGGDVAHAIPGGLDRRDFDFGQFREKIRCLLQLDPVVLNVLARGEMPESPIVGAGDVRKFPHLLRRQDAVGYVDPQHVGVKLHVEAVHQPKRLELVLGEFAGHAAFDLPAKLPDPLRHQLVIEFVVPVHGQSPPPPRPASTDGPNARMRSLTSTGRGRPLPVCTSMM